MCKRLRTSGQLLHIGSENDKQEHAVDFIIVVRWYNAAVAKNSSGVFLNVLRTIL